MPAIRLTVLGDSFVEGRGDPGPAGGYIGWADRLARWLGLPAASVRNFGTHQATARQVVERQLAPAVAAKAPLIGVVVGVNDLVQNYDAARFRADLSTLFGALAGTDTTVFTADYPDIPGNLPVPESFRMLLRERFAEANATLREVTTATGALLLELASAPEWAARSPLWSADGLHPGPAGHEQFATAAAELLTRTSGLIAA